MKQKENNSIYIIWFFAFIIFFPYSLFVLIIWILFFVIKTSTKTENVVVFILKKILFLGTDIWPKKQKRKQTYSIKKPTKNINIENIISDVYDILLERNDFKIEQVKIESILKRHNVHKNIDIRQKVIWQARKKFVSYLEAERKKKLENRTQKYDYNKNRNNYYKTKKTTPKKFTSKKFTPKKIETNFKSIWDDYESVIDIMERDKK